MWTNLGYESNTLVSKPDWETQNNLKGNDVMRSRLKLMFHSEYLFSKLELSVMMNMFYFNTKKANDIRELPNEIKKYCEAKTIEFINLIEPRNIIFFGSEANLKKIGLTNFNYLGRNIKTAKLDPLDVFILPHYGYFGAYSTEQGRATGDKLAEMLK